AKATKAAVCPGPTCNPAAAAACSAAASSMGVFSGQFSATVSAKTAADSAKTTVKVADETTKAAFWSGLWTKAKDFFNSESAGLNAVGKLPTEELADDAIRGAQYTVEETKMITEFTKDQASVGTVVALVKACSAFDMPIDGPALEASAKSALNAYVNYNYAPIECCGGDGLSLVQQNSLYAHNVVLASEINTLLGEPSVPMAQNIAKAKAAEQAQVTMMEKGFENITSQIDVAGGSTIVNPFKAMGAAQIIKGTLTGYGVPEVPKFASTKDMRVFGIFGDAAETGMKAPDNFKYYVKKNFESLLIKLALNAQLEKMNPASPQEELNEIADIHHKVEKIMHNFSNLVDKQGVKELAQAEYKDTKDWKVIVSMIGELIMPSAHAFLSSVGGQVAAGVGLKMVSDQLGLKGPWSGILNVGAQFMIMNAMLGKFARSWGLVSPKGRAYTWGAMAAINLAVLMLDKKAEKKVDKYIDAVKEERDRYIKSSGVATLDDPNAESETRDGNGKLKRKDGSRNNMYAAEGSGIKSCAVAKGDGFAPAVCPAPATKSQFNLPHVERDIATSVTPAHLEGAQFTSQISKGLATGSVGASELASLNLEKMEKRNLAMRTFNEKQMEKLDKEEAKNYNGQKGNPTPLSQMIAKAKKAISSSAGVLNSQPLLSSSETSKEVKDDTATKSKNGVIKTSVYGSTTGKPKAAEAQAGYDLDLFESGESEVVAMKPQEKLEDFVINHDDISKKKNVSIFKILSNRYLLSYPKVLEEK
ncbi:MAG: hypothetical protein KC478_08585, partial [Bacteriovoracaceae bacterium]|nr:hypothetical protein [Bacteriovoracaceae bacterium]